MTHTRIAVVGATALAGILAFSSVAFAENQSEVRRPETKPFIATTTTRDQEDTNDQEDGKDSNQKEDGQATSSERGEKGNGDDNRSEVAKHVKALLEVADKNGGIGEEIRAVAHEYASTTERVEKKKTEVEGRPGWIKILIGADYKNLGALRSEIVTTQNQIKRLDDARARATSSTTQSMLDTEIQALKGEASTTETFVKTHESSFSVFGWFVKWFQ